MQKQIYQNWWLGVGVIRNSVLGLVLAVGLIGCTGTKKLSSPEDFHKFHTRFYSDSAFHYSRISFPLEIQEMRGGERLQNENLTNTDTVQLTKKTLPRTIRSIDDYPDNYKSKITHKSTGVEELIYIPHSAYQEIRSFSLMNNRWYFMHLLIIDL
ncbi:MAG: hypothetical protein PF489_06630 [Salinivirgaceae bacterium]|jgi:hypothetical protein|nr:hypothetical protein [Salinivirgaceae bacterium]